MTEAGPLGAPHFKTCTGRSYMYVGTVTPAHRARNPGKQLNKKSAYSTFFESAENTAPLLPRTCMFYKIFSDDQEMATNQKIGLCDYLRTERPPPMLYSTIQVWRMGGSRGLLDKSVVYTQTMCPTYPEAAY